MPGSSPGPVWAPGYETSDPPRQGHRARIVRATRTTSGVEVILKILPFEVGQNELSHLRALSGVPGVVPLLDAGTTADGSFFVALPFYPDGSFGEMLVKKGPAPLQEAAAIARSVAGALGALHGRGLLHNDVCPGNVLRAGRTPVLTGFGAVCSIGESLAPPHPRTESFLHSPPEALRGDPRTAPSDVYQLASTIWTMLMGRAPFSATDGSPFDPQAYARRVLTEELPPVPRSDISRTLRRVLTRALSKDREDRYSDPAEFAAAFEKARAGRITAAPSTTQRSMSGTTPGKAPTAPPPSASSGFQASSVIPAPEETPASPGSVPPVSTEVSAPPEAHDGTGPQTSPDVSDFGAEPSFPPLEGRDDEDHLENTSGLRPLQRPLPTPEEREHHGATPETSPHSTADLMMAKLRGEDVSPLRAWARLEGWNGDVRTAYLPTDDHVEEDSSDPEWDLHSLAQEPPRWRKQMHIAVTVCGVLLAGGVASAFAATRPPEPMTVAAETEKEDETGEEAAAAEEEAPEAETPSPPPEVSAPTEVGLEDSFSSVTLTWTDNSGGTTSYFVLGERQGHEPLTMARTGPGTVTAQVSTENEMAEYCFTVIAVDGAAAPAEEVCTTRASDLAQLEEPEEEDEEEEDEDKEEDDADPSPTPSPDADD